jgi:hypothetical protein
MDTGNGIQTSTPRLLLPQVAVALSQNELRRNASAPKLWTLLLLIGLLHGCCTQGETKSKSSTDFILYQTPDEGYKLYVEEYRIGETIRDKPSGESAAEVNMIRGVLLTEEQVRMKYPEVLELKVSKG